MADGQFISQHLHRLFSDHDCVVIPGLGGFVCNDSPARYDEARQELIPPARDILFNERLIHNDGVLAHVFASNSGKSYAEALREIEREADWMRAALAAGDTVVLSHVGRLFRATVTDPISFAPDAELERLLRSFGLQRIPLQPLVNEVVDVEAPLPVTPQPEPTTKPQPVIERTMTPRNPVWRRIAAMLAVPVVAASAWWGVQGDAERLDMWPFGLMDAEKRAAFQPRFAEEGVRALESTSALNVNRFEALVSGLTDAESVRYDFLEDAPKPTGTLVQLRDKALVPELPKREVIAEAPARFWLVAGAFSVRENAADYAATAQAAGLPGAVQRSENGLSLVTVGTFAAESEARQALEDVRRAGKFQVWLKRL